MEGAKAKPHAVILSSPGLGHLIPVLELGRHLVTAHDSKVTIFVVSSGTSAAESQVIESSMSLKLCEVIVLPPPNISDLVDADAAVFTRIAVLMREIRPAFSSAMSSLRFPPTVLIVDFFGNESLEIADEFKIPKFVYVPSHAWFLALTIYLPILHEAVNGEYVDEKEGLFIPGCRPVQPEEVVDPMLSRSDQQYLEYLSMAIKISKSDGILVNTWEELEPATLAALRDDKLWGRISKAPIYPVGPITKQTRPIDSNKKLFEWLDKQPSESVLFVSFGSGGVLSKEQMRELAWGLELSQQRFIWVVRTPAVKSGDGSFFTVGNGNNDIPSYLPEGFLDRTNNVGLVISDWAPQVEILSHSAVGGFFSHCGWNSTLESIINEVPLIAWPLYAEQKMSATLLVEDLRIALRSKTLPSKGIVEREEIKMLVKRIMVDEEGHAIRARVKELKLSAKKAWNENGSSKALAQVLC
ncbi:anthocyanidin 3-O-glucosyltransferase 5-like [Durio zibethinus]|uniref:Glycosyltransferase n=1 Tax=Durio zibethinus TaxID=66656 RepID=A0A6P5YJC6_DURZI|nr:anthocyanidin 3-O-glucosyltransferase 5-like [Durio zibethinus]